MKPQMIGLLVVSLLVCATVAHAQLYDNLTAVGLNQPSIIIDLANQYPQPAQTGNTVDVRLAVANGGAEPLPDMVMEIVPSYPFTLAPGQPAMQDIGALQGYQGQANENQRVLKYTLLVDKDATAGTYNLRVSVHEPGSTGSIQQDVPIDVTSQQNAEVIQIDRTTLIPGRLSNMTFSISNVGGASLKDLVFSWQEANGVILPAGSDNTQYIRAIEVGKSAKVQYQVIADTNALPGLYKLSLSLRYLDTSNVQQNLTTIAGLYVGGPTEFTVAPSDSGTSQTSFSVANTGSNPASSVSVIIPPQRGWTVTGSNSVIIGNLNKGDYTVASFTLQSTANVNASGNSSRRQQLGGQGGGAFASNATLASDATPANGLPSENGRFGTNQTGMPGSSVLVRIEYSDTTGTRQSTDQLVSVATLSGGALRSGTRTNGATAAATTQNPLVTYKWYLIGLAIIVLGSLGYYRYKRRKLVNPSFKVKSMMGKSN
jgi:hypothetical protein